jgi:hypothetical protein
MWRRVGGWGAPFFEEFGAYKALTETAKDEERICKEKSVSEFSVWVSVAVFFLLLLLLLLLLLFQL